MSERDDKASATFANVQADIIIGKNLAKHLKDVRSAIEILASDIALAIINNEVVDNRRQVLVELFGLEWDILEQLTP